MGQAQPHPGADEQGKRPDDDVAAPSAIDSGRQYTDPAFVEDDEPEPRAPGEGGDIP
jgi:hypothetical protein